MALLPMKKLIAAVPRGVREEVVERLAALSCVQVETDTASLCAAYPWLVSPETIYVPNSEEESLLDRAKAILDSLCKVKQGLFAQKPEITAHDLYSRETVESGLKSARLITEMHDRMTERENAADACGFELERLSPWLSLDLPLNSNAIGRAEIMLGALPVYADVDKLNAEFNSEEHPLAGVITEVAFDGRRRYVLAAAHRNDIRTVQEILKNAGMDRISFDYSDTAAQRSAVLEKQRSDAKAEAEELRGQLKKFETSRETVMRASDALSAQNARAAISSGFATSGYAAVLEAWTPAEKENEVKEQLLSLGCAVEMNDPAEGDEPPTAVRNSKFSSNFESVTEMYGTPLYGSVIDPTPFMAPFYVVFFSFIISDVGYGLLLALGCFGALLLMKHPKRGMKNLLTMFGFCGIGSIVAGVLTGSLFGDALPLISEAFFGKLIPFEPLWFSPLEDPITMLIFSVLLGLVQVLVGMGLAAVRQIASGNWIGAIVDCFSWYLVVAGGAMMYFGLSWGLYLILAGVAIMLILGGYDKKGFGKVTGGLGKIYGVINYMSDLLSYTRIMALGLSGAVVAQVFNKIGTMAGNSPLGWVILIVAFVIGHIFNIATGVLGAYVHTGRLQYIEFFGKFFESGGRPFTPVTSKTKYTDITTKE